MDPAYTDPSWEQYYATHSGGRYPSEEAVRFFMARRPKDRAPTVLDIGAGAGSVAWFMARQGASVTALEGAPTALRLMGDTLDFFGVSGGVTAVAGNIVRPLDHVAGPFDLLVDHYSLYANDESSLRTALRDYRDLLAPGGSMLSCLFGPDCSGVETGRRTAPNTWQGIVAGVHADIASVSLWTEPEAVALFESAGFVVLATENILHRRGPVTTAKVILHLGRK